MTTKTIKQELLDSAQYADDTAEHQDRAAQHHMRTAELCEKNAVELRAKAKQYRELAATLTE